jgi:Ferredoxin subunits of nitrite reductase and ring-hydroxylating dioxygenases
MIYVNVAQTSDFSESEKKKITYEGIEILLAKIQDAYYAVDNKCPHMGGSLADGNLDGSHIICPRHGSIFDVTTGKAVGNGKMLFMKVKPNDLKTYAVKIENTNIMVGIE